VLAQDTHTFEMWLKSVSPAGAAVAASQDDAETSTGRNANVDRVVAIVQRVDVADRRVGRYRIGE
jgi:hypothetical protein